MLKLRPPLPGAQAQMGLFISTPAACPLVHVDPARQPGGNLQSFLSGPHRHIHRHRAWVPGCALSSSS